MNSVTTPGVYFQSLQPNRIRSDLLRSDIAAFIGYTERGPVGKPVRIESWRQFLAIFGKPLPMGYLAPAVKGFFENGGVSCYILRIVDANGRAASAFLPPRNSSGDNSDGSYRWQCMAAFRIADLVAVDGEDNAGVDSAHIYHLTPEEWRHPIADPGTWGNALRVTLDYKPRLSTYSDGVFNNGFSSYVSNRVGLEPYSIVQVSQEFEDGEGRKAKAIAVVEVESIDTARQIVHWKQSILTPSKRFPAIDGAGPPPAFDSDRPLRIDTVEVNLTIALGDRDVESFQWLGIHPLHSRSIHKMLSKNSQYLRIIYRGDDDSDWKDDTYWPPPVTSQALTGGQNGVSQIGAQDYLNAIAILREVDEIGVVGAPDLVLIAATVAQDEPVIRKTQRDCRQLSPPPPALVAGIVNDGGDALAGVTVTDLDSGSATITDADGAFTIAKLQPGLRILSFEKAGFTPIEQQLLAAPATASHLNIISLQARQEPRQLTRQEILTVQRAMGNQNQLGQYRIALLDPPAPRFNVDDIRAWRSQLGDSAIAAIYYPWLQVNHPISSDNTLLDLPPCGHVAGLIAKNDHLVGPHQAPANRDLRYCKDTAASIDEIHHGILNLESVNAIRALPGRGIRILGARTLSADSEWRYLSVRRLVLALKKTIDEAMQWAVFESNTTVVRQAIALSLGTLLNRQWRKSALAGKSQEAAYRIKCDADNNPSSEIDQGRLIAEIAIAPSVPFEFIRIRFDRTLDRIEVTE